MHHQVLLAKLERSWGRAEATKTIAMMGDALLAAAKLLDLQHFLSTREALPV